MKSREAISALVKWSPTAASTSASRTETPSWAAVPGVTTVQLSPGVPRLAREGLLTELAELLATDEPGEAAGHLDRCETIVSDGQDWRGLVATVELARAALAATRGDEAGSDARRSAAVDVFTRFRLPWHAAAALTDGAESLARRGAPDAAERQRARAHQLYASVGAADRWRERTSTALPRGFHSGRAG